MATVAAGAGAGTGATDSNPPERPDARIRSSVRSSRSLPAKALSTAPPPATGLTDGRDAAGSGQGQGWEELPAGPEKVRDLPGLQSSAGRQGAVAASPSLPAMEDGILTGTLKINPVLNP